MNKVYFNDFYNKEQKDRFINDQTEESTRKAYSRVLKRTALMEEKLNKDLYDFTLQEIMQFLLMLKATKLSSLQHTGSILHNYIGWAIDQDLRKDNINPLSAVTSFEWYSQFVDDSSKMLFTEKDITNIVAGCRNYQDAAPIQGIFEGIMGKANSELANMKMEHIFQDEHGEYHIKLINDTTEGSLIREIPISEDLYDILRVANKEDKYLKNNGIVSDTAKSKFNELVENDYIIRTAINARSEEENIPVQGQIISLRVKKVAKWNDLPQLTPINIRNSGMLKLARELYNKNGKLDREEYSEICKRFNINQKPDGAYVNLLKKNFLNIDNIERLYGFEE